MIMSSFGIGERRTDNYSQLVFERMPPALFCKKRKQFVPDYASLLVADSIILDSSTVEGLKSHRSPLFHEYGQVLEALEGEGFARTEDYSAVLHEESATIREAIELDLDDLSQLLSILDTSIQM